MIASLGNLAGRLAERKGTLAEAESTYNRAFAIEKETLAPNDPSLAITLSNYAALKDGKGTLRTPKI